VSLVDVAAAILFLGVVAYAVFGGADFGSGLWDLTAGDARRGGPLRALIDRSIGPVWEANHVWLVFVLVYLWTGFPDGFAAIMETMFVPFSLAGLGIVARGAAFAFRKFAPDLASARIFGALFATSSVVTPLLFGAVVGGIVSGRVPADGPGDRWTSWTGPTSLVGGVLAVLTCSFLAATFLVAEAERQGDQPLAEACRRRALGAGLVTGAVALAGIAPLADDAPTLFDRLTGRALPLIVLSALAGSFALVALWQRRPAWARVGAVAAVASVVVGWGVAQYPWLLVDHLELADAAGADATLWGLLVTFAIAGLTAVPALVYLYWITQRGPVAARGPADPVTGREVTVASAGTDDVGPGMRELEA
jgi:cytochrome d ubiquinol oxidase subunit II